MSDCANAGAGHRISSTPRIASAISDVTSASCTSCWPVESLSNRHLVPARIGAADYATFADIGMLQNHAFDLRRVDVFAAGDDEVLLAVMDPEITVGVAPADVAGAIPAVAQRFPRCFLVAPIFDEHVGAAHSNLPRYVRRQFVAGVVDEGSLAAQAGEPGRTLAREVAAEAGVDCNRAGFGRAVDLQHRYAAHHEAVDQMRRHDG